MAVKGKDADRKSGTAKSAVVAPVVKIDDSCIINAYANVCNVSSSREEVALVFGVNNAWERDASAVHVKLNSRVILSPFAAKRLALLLNSVVQQYETRFGIMEMSVPLSEQIPTK